VVGASSMPEYDGAACGGVLSLITHQAITCSMVSF